MTHLVDMQTDSVIRNLLKNWTKYEEEKNLISIDPKKYGKNTECEELAKLINLSEKNPNIFDNMRPFELNPALIIGKYDSYK